MKFETLMLKSFFAASLLVCVLTLGSMIASRPNASSQVVNHSPVAAATNSAG
jgi:hypothetical protein